MEVGVVVVVHTDDCRGRTSAWVRKHADEYQKDVVDPIELVIAVGGEASRIQDVDTSCSGFEVGTQRVVFVFGVGDVGDGLFGGGRVHGDLYAVVAFGVPVGAHYYDAADGVGEGFVAAFFPVCGAGGFLAEHHC